MLEIAILPLCATLLVPMSFYELYTTVAITAVIFPLIHSQNEAEKRSKYSQVR